MGKVKLIHQILMNIHTIASDEKKILQVIHQVVPELALLEDRGEENNIAVAFIMDHPELVKDPSKAWTFFPAVGKPD